MNAGGEGGCEEVNEDREESDDVEGEEDRAKRGVPMLPIPEEDDVNEEEDVEEEEDGEGDEGEEAPLEEEEEELESLRWYASASSKACIWPSISTVASCSDLTTASLAGSRTCRSEQG